VIAYLKSTSTAARTHGSVPGQSRPAVVVSKEVPNSRSLKQARLGNVGSDTAFEFHRLLDDDLAYKVRGDELILRNILAAHDLNAGNILIENGGKKIYFIDYGQYLIDANRGVKSLNSNPDILPLEFLEDWHTGKLVSFSKDYPGLNGKGLQEAIGERLSWFQGQTGGRSNKQTVKRIVDEAFRRAQIRRGDETGTIFTKGFADINIDGLENRLKKQYSWLVRNGYACTGESCLITRAPVVIKSGMPKGFAPIGRNAGEADIEKIKEAVRGIEGLFDEEVFSVLDRNRMYFVGDSVNLNKWSVNNFDDFYEIAFILPEDQYNAVSTVVKGRLNNNPGLLNRFDELSVAGEFDEGFLARLSAQDGRSTLFNNRLSSLEKEFGHRIKIKVFRQDSFREKPTAQLRVKDLADLDPPEHPHQHFSDLDDG
jgi:hypothetical protein